MVTTRPPNQRVSCGYPVLVPEVRGVSSEIILVIHLDEIRDPSPHMYKG